jgi:plastocyanin
MNNSAGGTTEGKGRAMRKGCGAICVLFGIVLLTACGNDVPDVPKDEATSTAPAGQAVRVVDVTLSFVEPRFRPDPLEIKIGEPVRFKVGSADTRHRLVIESLGIDVEVPQKSLNESVTTKTVTPTKAGTYRIFCSVHARMQMEGMLVVSGGEKRWWMMHKLALYKSGDVQVFSV